MFVHDNFVYHVPKLSIDKYAVLEIFKPVTISSGTECHVSQEYSYQVNESSRRNSHEKIRCEVDEVHAAPISSSSMVPILIQNNVAVKLLNLTKDNSWLSFQSKKNSFRGIECSYCGCRFPGSASLMGHKCDSSSQHPESPFSSGASFSSSSSSISGSDSISSAEAKYNCGFCKKNFSFKSSWESHMTCHSGEKKYSCHICSARFAHKSTLKVHLRIHSGDRPFQCKICQLTFPHKTSLNRHYRTHTGEKPFQCSSCSKCFRDQSTLSRHMRVHSGQRPFQCNFCGRSFSQNSHLKRHLISKKHK